MIREVTLPHTLYQLKINGDEYDVLLSDAELLVLHGDLLQKLKDVNAKDSQSVLSLDRYIADLIEKILGKGALASISGGSAVNISDKITWLLAIIAAVDAMHFEHLVKEND